MQLPTPEQVEMMMTQKFGELPEAIKSAKEVDASFLTEQAVSSKFSTNGEANALDPKTTTLVFLAAALASNNSECIEVNTKALIKMGASKEEILSVVRIVRHAAASGVVGNAKTIFDLLK